MKVDVKIKEDFSGLEKLARSIKDKYIAKVGILGNETDPESGQSIASIGATHEFGSASQNIPQRSFIRMPLSQHLGKKIKANKEVFLKELRQGNIKEATAMLATEAVGVIKDAFASEGDGKWPKLSPKTINKKGSSGILVDKGNLKSSITYKVEKV